MKNIVIRFGLLALAVFLLVELSKYSLFRFNDDGELIVVTLAVIFIGLGIYLSRFVIKSKKVAINESDIDEEAIKRLGLSEREYEVLEEMAKGKSNLEIANTLFISESTVKTHVSNILVKLNAKRRTEAINVAIQNRIIKAHR